MGIFKGSMSFMLGVASGVAARRMWERYAKQTGKEGTELLVQGVGAALAAGREMTRKAARFMEEVEDIVAEAKVELNNAQATATATASKEPAAPPTGPERV